MARHSYNYKCPACYLYRQNFEARNRQELQSHLFYSHPQMDLIRVLVKQVTGSKQ